MGATSANTANYSYALLSSPMDVPEAGDREHLLQPFPSLNGNKNLGQMKAVT